MKFFFINLIGSELHLFILFSVIILLFLVIDLGILNKKAKTVSTKSALYQTLFWIFISIGFGIIINEYLPQDVANIKMWEYYTAYATEKALSVDNIFVIILILKYFRVREEYYHKILFWGILGALVFRGIFIYLGAELVHSAEFFLHLFGLILLYSGIKLIFAGDEDDFNPEESKVVKFCKKHLKVSQSDYGGKFIIRENGGLLFTPLFIVLALIETTDLIFAVDSIPAAFGVTQDSFILYTSNIFAILGLRAMFFLLQGILQKFYLLQKGLSLILIFIGGKMIAKIPFIEEYIPLIKHINDLFDGSPYLSFSIVFGILAISMILSVLMPIKEKKE